MNRKTRILFTLSFILFVLLGAGYTYAWFYGAKLIRIQITMLYDDAAKVGMRIEGNAPTISGFPGPHIVRFSGRLVEGSQILNVPALRIRGLFLPGHSIEISLPQGASLQGSVDPSIFSIDDLDINATIPVLIPVALDAEDLAAWQQQGGVIAINRFHMRKESLTVDGTGRIALDPQLQPTGAASVRIHGYQDFVDWLKGKGVLHNRQAAFAGIILAGLSQTDAATGETYLKTDINLKNRVLYVGPLGVLTLPPVTWVSRHPPAPPR